MYELRSEETGEEDAVSLQQVRMGTGRSGESAEILPRVWGSVRTGGCGIDQKERWSGAKYRITPAGCWIQNDELR